MYLIDLPVKILMSITLSFIAFILFMFNKTRMRKDAMLFMFFSSIGDFFMTEFIYINSTANLIIGAGSFIVGHIIMGLSYIKTIKENNQKLFNKGFYVGLILMIIFLVVLTILSFTIPNEYKTVNYLLVLLYSIIIGFNVCCNFSYSYNVKGNQLLVMPFAIILFYITDFWIFIDMTGVYDFLHTIVWYVYPFAQLLLMIFVEPLTHEKTNGAN